MKFKKNYFYQMEYQRSRGNYTIFTECVGSDKHDYINFEDKEIHGAPEVGIGFWGDYEKVINEDWLNIIEISKEDNPEYFL